MKRNEILSREKVESKRRISFLKNIIKDKIMHPQKPLHTSIDNAADFLDSSNHLLKSSFKQNKAGGFLQKPEGERSSHESFNTVRYEFDETNKDNENLTEHSTHSLIKEIDCSINNLESFIVCKETKIPLFGYPQIAFARNINTSDKAKYLWDQVAKPILSRNTKRCIFKDLIESHRSIKRMEDYMYNSFTAGRPISMNTVSNFQNINFRYQLEDINPVLKEIRESK